jgi:hypothetical protein
MNKPKLVHYVAMVWAATVLSVLLIASHNSTPRKMVLSEIDGNYLSHLSRLEEKALGEGKGEASFEDSRLCNCLKAETRPHLCVDACNDMHFGLCAGSKLWRTRVQLEDMNSHLSTDNSRKSINNYFDHLEVTFSFKFQPDIDVQSRALK